MRYSLPVPAAVAGRHGFTNLLAREFHACNRNFALHGAQVYQPLASGRCDRKTGLWRVRVGDAVREMAYGGYLTQLRDFGLSAQAVTYRINTISLSTLSTLSTLSRTPCVSLLSRVVDRSTDEGLSLVMVCTLVTAVTQGGMAPVQANRNGLPTVTPESFHTVTTDNALECGRNTRQILIKVTISKPAGTRASLAQGRQSGGRLKTDLPSAPKGVADLKFPGINCPPTLSPSSEDFLRF